MCKNSLTLWHSDFSSSVDWNSSSVFLQQILKRGKAAFVVWYWNITQNKGHVYTINLNQQGVKTLKSQVWSGPLSRNKAIVSQPIGTPYQHLWPGTKLPSSWYRFVARDWPPLTNGNIQHVNKQRVVDNKVARRGPEPNFNIWPVGSENVLIDTFKVSPLLIPDVGLLRWNDVLLSFYWSEISKFLVS